MKKSAFRILIVDDDENDRFLLQKAFADALGDRGLIESVEEGETAIRYLAGEGDFTDRSRHPFPNILITDLNMPGKDGLAVLEFMGNNPAWSVVPRIVLSSSHDDDDITKAYLLGATAYHIKPHTSEERTVTVGAIVDYWRRCEVPPVDENGKLLTTESHARVGKRYPPPKGGEKMVRPAE